MISAGALRRDRPEPAPVIVAAVLVAAAVGALVAIAPLAGVAVTAAGVVLTLILMRPSRIPRLFIGALGVVLVLYALGDRGIAYVGVGPIYMGEMVLALGLLAMLVTLPRRRFGLLDALLLGFIALGAARTIPYIGEYGLEALRDAVAWGYALFALAVAGVFRPEWFPAAVRIYRYLVPVMLVWFPVAVAAGLVAGSVLPHWPGAPVPIIEVKQGDAGVHLAGIGAFVLTGLYASGPRLVRDGVVWALWFANTAMVAAISRGGMLAVLLGAGSSVLFIRSSVRILQGAAIAIAFFVALYLVNPSIELGYAGRPVSFTQLVSNLSSVVTDNGNSQLEGTRAWRLAWWDEIVEYTVDGPYFWTGKGFGINLADDDGFQVNSDGSLRSPHNGHLTMLARGGVPMLFLWLLIQVAFAFGLLRAGVRALRSQSPLLPVIAVLFAYWLAALINMSFDVYLEGPQGGIPFWSVIGLGMVAMRATRSPSLAAVPEAPDVTAAAPGAQAPARLAPVGQSSPGAATLAVAAAGPATAAPATPSPSSSPAASRPRARRSSTSSPRRRSR